MESIYVGGGQHLKVGADLENGIYGVAETEAEGGRENAFVGTHSQPAIDYPFVTAMLKGREGNHFSVKAGNAQNGSLSTLYDGPRPSGGNKNYAPMKKQGAIILGIGGDNSPWAGGIFVSFAQLSVLVSERWTRQRIASLLLLTVGFSAHTNAYLRTPNGSTRG
jgi:hypothetical protein